MRHRDANDQENQPGTPTQAPTQTTGAGRARMLSDLMEAKATVQGKHRALVVETIPTQLIPTHDDQATVALPELPKLSSVPALVAVPSPTAAGAAVKLPVAAAKLPVAPVKFPVAPVKIPLEARWKASHIPRTLAAGLLVLGVLGTSGLAVRYAGSRTSDNFLSLAIGLVVVVVLWALVIVGTPQVVSLNGSILEIHTTSGSEHFNLADGLQPVDVVGDPRTSHWAVLLHRGNGTTAVLRRHDVEPLEFDTIVRHYRKAATQHSVEREARFNL